MPVLALDKEQRAAFAGVGPLDVAYGDRVVASGVQIMGAAFEAGQGAMDHRRTPFIVIPLAMVKALTVLGEGYAEVILVFGQNMDGVVLGFSEGLKT